MLNETVIELTDVEHSYGSTEKALASVSVTIRSGEFVAVIGKNGSGKTTLAKHVNGLLRPTNPGGQVLVRTRDGELADPRRFKLHQLAPMVGYVFQNPDRQIFHDTCREELEFGPTNLGVNPQTTAQRVAETLALVGLTGREEENPVQLSRGERQRLAIASVLVMESDVAVIDEPTTGQDPDEARLILECLARYQAAGHTVVIISHDMGLVAQYATRIIAMQAGRVLADDAPTAVFAQPEVLKGTNIRPPQAAVLAAELGLPGAITVDDAVRQMRTAAQAQPSANAKRM